MNIMEKRCDYPCQLRDLSIHASHDLLKSSKPARQNQFSISDYSASLADFHLIDSLNPARTVLQQSDGA